MIRYRLDDLGWYQFEWLCQSLLKSTLGLLVEAWGGHSDFGRDAYSKTPISFDGSKTFLPGPIVFQAKFVAEANAAGAQSDSAIQAAVRGEASRILERLLKEREKTGLATMPNAYVLLTNAPLSAQMRDKLTAILGKILPRTQVLIWDGADLCAMLDDAPNIRVSFPQLLGLRDLTELLRSVIEKVQAERSTLAIDQAVELAAIFVPTTAYSKALETLSNHGFVVLTGPPEMGKTTIARMIGLSKFGEGWGCYECKNPDDVLQLRRADQTQVFIADDAFGTTEYRPEIAHAWASEMDRILRVVGPKHWLIWTSRPAPLHAALQKMHLQGRGEKFPQPGEVLVDAAQLSTIEKALMLYRHAKVAGLEKEAKLLVRHHAEAVVRNSHFTPERVRRFVSYTLNNLKSDQVSKNDVASAIMREIEQPTDSMKKSFDSLSPEHRQILISILDAGSGGVFFDAINDAHQRIFEREIDGMQIGDLSAHFLRVKADAACPMCHTKDGKTLVEWMHPSWRDLVIERLASDSDIRRTFLAKCGVEGFLLAISSGGGAVGKRNIPLVANENDWKALSITAARLTSHEPQNVVWRILTAISEMAKRLSEDGGVSPILGLLDLVLSAYRSRCADNCWTTSPATLRLYYSISEYLEPMPPGPNLKLIWNAVWSATVEEMATFDLSEEDLFLGEITDWIGLVRTIAENEPRFLRQMNFPTQYTLQVRDFLPKLGERAELCPDLGDDDDCNNEEYRLDEISGISDHVATFFKELYLDVERLNESLDRGRNGIEIVREKIKRKEQEERDLDDDDVVSRYRSSLSNPNNFINQSPATPSAYDVFDISRLFDDL